MAGHLSVPPNGPRLSCGANAGGRKRPALRYRLAGGRSYASSESRPRQLQALVRAITYLTRVKYVIALVRRRAQQRLVLAAGEATLTECRVRRVHTSP